MLVSEQVRESIKELRDRVTDEYIAARDKPDMVLINIIETFELMEQRISNIECFLKRAFEKGGA